MLEGVNQTLSILAKMDWPASFALIGIAASVAIGMGARAAAKTSRINKAEDLKIEKVKADRDVDLATAKNTTTQLPAVSNTRDFEG